MRRWMIYVVVVGLALLLKPKDVKDVGELIPVELLYINREAGSIRAETDTGAVGTGRNLEEALNDLTETAPGTIFLETADYLIVTDRTVNLLPRLTEVLRPATQVCVGINAGADAAAFLKAHPSEMTLKNIRAGQEDIPTLIGSKERYHFGESWKGRQKA